jgi:hypothetical protein
MTLRTKAPPPTYCIPNICPVDEFTEGCEQLIHEPLTINRVYSVGYAVVNEVFPNILGITGVPQQIETELKTWYITTFVVVTLPIFVILLVLLSVLTHNKTISLSTGLILICSLIFLSFVVTIFIIYNTDALVSTIYGIFTNIESKFSENLVDIGELLAPIFNCPDHYKCTNPSPPC